MTLTCEDRDGCFTGFVYQIADYAKLCKTLVLLHRICSLALKRANYLFITGVAYVTLVCSTYSLVCISCYFSKFSFEILIYTLCLL